MVGALIGGSLAAKQTSPVAEQPLQKPRKASVKMGSYFLTLGMLVLIGWGLFEFFSWYYRFDFDYGDPRRGAFILTAASLLLMVILLGLRPLRNAATSSSIKPTKNRWFYSAYPFFRNYLVYALLIGGLLGSGVGLAVGYYSFVLPYGLGSGFSGLLLSLLFVNRPTRIQPAEILIWSRRSLRHSLLARNHVKNALLIGCIVTFTLGLNTTTASMIIPPSLPGEEALHLGLIVGLSVGLPAGVIYWSLVGFLQGISHDTFPDRERTSPNQGMKRSIQNGLLLALVSGGISAPICTLGALPVAAWSGVLPGPYFVWNATVISNALTQGLQVALSVGLLVGLLRGGLAWWRHWVLRFLLWSSRVMPWNIVQTLDEAVRHILLCKSGGGYRFIHERFRDYLTSLGTTPSSAPPNL